MTNVLRNVGIGLTAWIGRYCNFHGSTDFTGTKLQVSGAGESK